ncbi:MAG: hypothetical protein KTR15_11250 [Phycisphaeraceae bacterium]|nr:hypothetical protein [Phycisphaeraceae bacterium]
MVTIRGEGGEQVTRPVSNAGELLVLKELLESPRVVLRDNNLLVTGFADLVE